MSITTKTLLPQLQAEVEEVQASLQAVAEKLSFPLNNLVRAEVNGAAPYVRAGVVLAASYRVEDDELLRKQRICLASALEMLHIALSIHKSLLPATAPPIDASLSIASQEPAAIHEADKVVMGSTILAGDYCFSRSAAMATQTGNPDVVNIFAEALKAVSEAHLRGIFDDAPLPGQEDQTLITAGIEAAAKLTSATQEETNAHIEISTFLLHCLGSDSKPSTILQDNPSLDVKCLTQVQLARWQEIFDWLLSHS